MPLLKATAAAVLLLVCASCGPGGGDVVRSERSVAPRPDDAEVAISRPGTSDDPLRVLLVGDSIAITLEPSLSDAVTRLKPRLGPSRVLQGAALGFGLTADRASLYEGRTLAPMHPDYLATWRSYTKAHEPDVVVAMLGTWDAVPRLVDGRWLRPGDPGWTARYRELLLDATDALAASGAHVTWLTEPCVDVPNQPGPVNEVLRAAREELKSAGATLVDLDAILCPQGEFTASLRAPDGALVKVRRDDGVHFADAAPRALGPLLADLLVVAWGLS